MFWSCLLVFGAVGVFGQSSPPGGGGTPPGGGSTVAPDYKAFVRDLKFEFTNNGSDVEYIDHTFQLRGDGPIVDWTATFFSPVVDPAGSGTASEAVSEFPKAGINPIIINLGACSPQGPTLVDLGQSWRTEWHPHGGGVYTMAGELDLSKLQLQSGRLFYVRALQEFDIDLAGVFSFGGAGQFTWTKPGLTRLRCPIPVSGETVGSPVGGCNECGCGTNGTSNSSNNEAIQLYKKLKGHYVNDAMVAHLPSECQSCGGGSAMGNAIRLYRQHRPGNVVWNSNFGRGFGSTFDSVLKVRQDSGGVAYFYDAQLGVVFKFREKLEGVNTGGGGPPGGSDPSGLQGTGIFEPVDTNWYTSYSFVDENGDTVFDPVTESETKKVFATLVRKDGQKTLIRLIDRHNGRVVSETNSAGEAITYTYKTWTEEEIRLSPTRLMQIDQISFPCGGTMQFSYHGDKKAGRWAVSQIVVDGNTIDYAYNSNGLLSTVTRTRPGRQAFVQSSYQYDYSNNDGVHVEVMEFDGTDFVTTTKILTANYDDAFIDATPNDGVDDRALDDIQPISMPWLDPDEFGGLGDTRFERQLQLVNQIGNAIVGEKNGIGQTSLEVFMGDSPTQIDDNKIRAIYNGKLLEYSVGQSIRYAKSIPGSPGDFTQGDFETSSDGEMFAANINTTVDEILKNIPTTHRDENGYITTREYDANGNLTKSKHSDGSEEIWQYNDASQLLYYRDRNDLISRTNRDSNGRVVEEIYGLKLVNGSEIAPAGAMKTVYSYGPNDKLAWTATVKYSFAGDPPADYRTSYTYDTECRLIKILKPAIQTDIGVLTRPEITYNWVNDTLVSVISEGSGSVASRTISYEYDDYGRLVRTNFADGSKTETWFDDANRRIYKRDRTGIVSRVEKGGANRVLITRSAYGKDTGTILDGHVQNVSSGNLGTKVRKRYYAGWDMPYETFVNEKRTRVFNDYRGRARTTFVYTGAGRYERDIVDYYDNRPFKHRHTVYQHVNGAVNYSTTVRFNGYSALGHIVRVVKFRDNGNLADNQAVMDLNPQNQDTPDYLITDVVRDLSGNTIELIASDEIKTRIEYDDSGREIVRHDAYGTAEQISSHTEYDDFGRVSARVAPDGIRNEMLYDPSGNLVETKIVPISVPQFAAESPQVTKYTFTLKGQPKKSIANDGGVTEQFYSDCCGRTTGTRNALGHGTIVNRDAAGRVVHEVTVGNFDSEWGNALNPSTSNTYSEITTKYDDGGRKQFATKWSQDPMPGSASLDPNNPPIAGLGTHDISEGVTTQFVYDDNLANNSGLETTTGLTIPRLHPGGVTAINIKEAFDKIADSEANGGAELSPNSNDSLSARVVISRDEKTMRVSISNQTGQTSMNALMTGPAHDTPNVLLDWTCQRRGRRLSGSLIPGHAWTMETKTIYPDGTNTRAYINGFGQTVAKYDQEGNRARSIYNAAGRLHRSIDPLLNEVVYTYDKLGRTIQVDGELQTSASKTYDSGGRILTSTDPKGNVGTNVYDGFGRLRIVRDRTGAETLRTYDNMNRLTSIKDAENKETIYQYDFLGTADATYIGKQLGNKVFV